MPQLEIPSLTEKLYKTYVKDGVVTLPEKLAALVKREGRYKITDRKDANQIVEFAGAITAASIIFHDHPAAKAALLAGFNTLNGSAFWSSDYSGGGWRGCMCDVAERLGSLANRYGFPDITEQIRYATRCPESPPGYRPRITPCEVPAPEEVLARAESCLQHAAEEIGAWL